MLQQSDLPKRFWADALVTAAHLRNFWPTTSSDDIPWERWHGRKLEEEDLQYLRIFGCRAWYHVKEIGPKG
jgi:hypothetical protein